MTTTTFKPLLAATAKDLSSLSFPVLVSPKLDGIRCVKQGGRALSRKLKPIPNDYVRTWIETHLPDGVDGELMLRDTAAPFREVSSAIMSKAGEPDFVYMAFDYLEPALGSEVVVPFEQRLDSLYALWHGLPKNLQEKLAVVEHLQIFNEGALRKTMQEFLDFGYEGAMVRDPKGRYKFGRSTEREGILLKIKEFHDEDATVVGVLEQMHNENEAEVDNLGHTKRSSAKAGKVGARMLGALECVTDDGAEFQLGTGFTTEQRIRMWGSLLGQHLVGRRLKFKHQPPPGGRKDGEAPRFPVFLDWRED